jgi:hypothetical protein
MRERKRERERKEKEQYKLEILCKEERGSTLEGKEEV